MGVKRRRRDARKPDFGLYSELDVRSYTDARRLFFSKFQEREPRPEADILEKISRALKDEREDDSA